MGTSATGHPTTAAARPVAGGRSVAAGALARLASIAALATLSWPDGFGAVGPETVNLPILVVSGILLSTGALVAHTSRHGRPRLRLGLLVVSALSAWAVPTVLVLNLALLYFAVTEPGEICHDLPCREGVTLTILLLVAALASVADALLSTTGAGRMCRRLPAGALRRAGWSVLSCGAALTAASIAFFASRW
jgi:hypothetical protein